eukprot:scaffold20585_cov118-Isochrysis_galbana.AAC.2
MWEGEIGMGRCRAGRVVDGQDWLGVSRCCMRAERAIGKLATCAGTVSAVAAGIWTALASCMAAHARPLLTGERNSSARTLLSVPFCPYPSSHTLLPVSLLPVVPCCPYPSAHALCSRVATDSSAGWPASPPPPVRPRAPKKQKEGAAAPAGVAHQEMCFSCASLGHDTPPPSCGCGAPEDVSYLSLARL